MKSAVHFLVLVVLVGSALSDNCSKSCQKCVQDKNKKNQCGVCYRTILDNGACVSGAPANCDVAVSNDYCYRCSAGYQLDVASGSCAKTTIANCINGYVDTDQITRCEACSPGSPSSDLTSCTSTQKYQNCMWEAASNCERCKDGYQFDPKRGACVVNTIKGCLFVSSSGDCDGCNVYSNYFMTSPGKCASGTSIEQALKLLLTA